MSIKTLTENSTSTPQHVYFTCIDGEDGLKVVRHTQKEALWREKRGSHYRELQNKQLLHNDDFEKVIIE